VIILGPSLSEGLLLHFWYCLKVFDGEGGGSVHVYPFTIFKSNRAKVIEFKMSFTFIIIIIIKNDELKKVA